MKDYARYNDYNILLLLRYNSDASTIFGDSYVPIMIVGGYRKIKIFLADFVERSQ